MANSQDSRIDAAIEGAADPANFNIPSRTSGGVVDDGDDPRGVEPDEFVKRETAVFEPGTGRKAMRHEGRKPEGDEP